MSKKHSGLCNAQTPRGPCRRRAGWGTDHKGRGPCRDHEGDVEASDDLAFFADSPAIRDLARRHAKTGKPFDVTEDVALARAMRDLYMNRFEDSKAAVLEWALDTGRTPPASLTDPLHARAWFETIATLVNADSRSRSVKGLTREEIEALFVAYAECVQAAAGDVVPRYADLGADELRDLLGDLYREIQSRWATHSMGA